jgi:ABC-2 type transport system ATP-binding protein
VEWILETVGLWEARDRMANRLSGGMKRRLGIAQALVGEPRILVVDEPTTGLDPEERLKFRNLLSEMSHQDMVIILSTHIVGDISSSCERMAMLNHGELVFDGDPKSLVNATREFTWLIRATDKELEQLRETYSVISTIPSQKGWEVQVVGIQPPNGFHAEPFDPTLEHAYVHFLEQKLGEKLEYDAVDFTE